MSTDQEFEEQLARALAAVGDSLPGDGPLTATAGLARGRRRWRRRSALAVAGSATALALVGSGTYALVAAGPATVSPAPVAPPASAAPSPSRLKGAPAVSVGRLYVTLQDALPPAFYGGPFGAGLEGVEPHTAFLRTVYDDVHGRSQVSVTIAHRSGSAAAGAARCPDAKRVRVDSCRTTTLADGAVLTVLQGYQDPDRRTDIKRWTATLSGTDGRWIELTEWNAPNETDTEKSRVNPPLDAAQLGAAVTSTAWNPIFAALAAAPDTPAPVPPAQFRGRDIMATARTLVPAELTKTDGNGDGEGYADFTVRDANGTSMVGVNVQDWRRNLADLNAGKGGAAAQVYASAATLPDGTRVAESQEGHNPGRWVVDALRPDGLRVVVTVYNSAGPQEAADRATPVLTTEQMRAIALSPAWSIPSELR